jgi:predicted membrane channel-forming protein YqfA (hemolysin III family)
VPPSWGIDRGEAAVQETDDERLQREHEQLFHELRSIIPGVEVLFAFMLTVAFTERFERLTDAQRSVYYATFLCAGVAILLLLAPASFHRVRFRQDDKEAMLRIANVEAIAALVLISIAVAGTVFLITDLMFSSTLATVVSALVWVATGVLWWGVPLTREATEQEG